MAVVERCPCGHFEPDHDWDGAQWSERRCRICKRACPVTARALSATNTPEEATHDAALREGMGK